MNKERRVPVEAKGCGHLACDVAGLADAGDDYLPLQAKTNCIAHLGKAETSLLARRC